MYRVARNPAAGARGPAGAVLFLLVALTAVSAGGGEGRGQSKVALMYAARACGHLAQAFQYTAPAGPRAPAAGLRATRYIRLLEQARATRASPDY